MTLEEIFKLWEEDSRIDESELGREALNIPILHHKWLRIYSEQKLRFKKMEMAYKALRHKKLQFYTYGPDEETRAAGWELPPRGKILKTEAGAFVDSDRDVVEAGVALAEQAEIVDALQDIVKSVNNRNFVIRNAIEWNRFVNGG